MFIHLHIWIIHQRYHPYHPAGTPSVPASSEVANRATARDSNQVETKPRGGKTKTADPLAPVEFV